MAIIGKLARVAAHALLPQFVRMGISANESLRQFKRMGYAMRRTDFLAEYRNVAGVARARPYMSALTRNVRPDPLKLAGRDMFDAPSYKLRGKAFFVNKTTGEVHEQWVTLYDNYLRSKNEYMSEFENQFGERFIEYDSQLTDIVWIDLIANTSRL